MRIKNTIKNSIYSITSNLLALVLVVIVRRLFIRYFSVELLGYEGFFVNIFSLMSVADLGIPMLIQYRLYASFAKGNIKRTGVLIAICKKIYAVVGIVILLIGMILMPYLKLLFPDTSYSWNYLYIIYIMQLANTLCTYFLAYRRLLFVADQKEYKCIKVESICTLIVNILKILIIVVLSNYIVYLAVSLAGVLFSNAVIYWLAAKQYPFIKKERVKIKNINEEGIIADIKNNIIQKISLVIYGGTDSILISVILGVTQTGLFSNYIMISSYVTRFLNKIYDSFQASVGNYVNLNSTDEKYNLFRMLDLAGFFIASFVTVSYIVLYNPAISLWLGDEYLLDNRFVLAFSLNQYVGYVHSFVCLYRNTCGWYELDRPYIMFGAIANVILSITLGSKMGIAGIMIGTAVGHIGIWCGRVRVVYKKIFSQTPLGYVWTQIRNIIICSGEIVLTLTISKRIPYTVFGLLLRMLVCVCVPFAINSMVFCRTEEFAMIIKYVRTVKHLIFRRSD